MRLFFGIAVFLILALQCCKPTEPLCPEPLDKAITLDLPAYFPSINFPEDNALTEKRVELGRRLFYDTRLSSDGTVSCGSCHSQDLAFSDGLIVSEGVENRMGFRNAPSLGNVAYQERLFAEGGVPNLEIQALAPIGDENEFDHDVNIIEADLQADEVLNNLSQTAYDREIDIYVVTRALAAFERTLITANSKYDKVMQGQATFTDEEELGRTLFYSEELACGTCHSGHNFSDGDFHNIGIYETYEDEGKFRITNEVEDIGKFKTPSLRNVELTAPYIHNGSVQTLEEVIEHFNSGGMNHENQSELIVPLNLTDNEKSALISFLVTLTDEEFIINPDFNALN